MNYTINANIYNIVDVNYRKKDSKGVLLASDYKKEQAKKRAFSLSTEANVETYTAEEIIAKVKTQLNLPETVVDVKLTAQGNDLPGTVAVTAYGVKFEASFPCKTPEQVGPVVEAPVAPTPAPAPVEETPVVETPVTPTETPENPA